MPCDRRRIELHNLYVWQQFIGLDLNGKKYTGLMNFAKPDVCKFTSWLCHRCSMFSIGNGGILLHNMVIELVWKGNTLYVDFATMVLFVNNNAKRRHFMQGTFYQILMWTNFVMNLIWRPNYQFRNHFESLCSCCVKGNEKFWYAFRLLLMRWDDTGNLCVWLEHTWP